MDTQRIIGRLEATAKHVEKQLQLYGEHSEKRFNRIEGKLDTLLADKWKRHGAGMVISAIVAFVATMVVEIVKGK